MVLKRLPVLLKIQLLLHELFHRAVQLYRLAMYHVEHQKVIYNF